VGSTPTVSAKELKALDENQGLFSLVELDQVTFTGTTHFEHEKK
jgi:hypothetical protein